jgi:CubicO group peptidase (beta-lactamase class C family)
LLNPDLVRAGYGMGWIAQTYRDGRRLNWHDGVIDGFSTFIGFFPEDDLGLVILTNSGAAGRALARLGARPLGSRMPGAGPAASTAAPSGRDGAPKGQPRRGGGARLTPWRPAGAGAAPSGPSRG